jgi:hypothetical protein
VNAVTETGYAADAQRAKLLALFCALGLAMFLIDLGAGIWLWHYMGQYKPILPGGQSEPMPPDDVDGTWK